jgi:hypothetical protein
MIKFKQHLPALALACSTVFAAAPSFADSVTSVSQAANFFQNAVATGGKPFTVDAKGPVAISDDVELPGFAFQVYDVDFTSSSVTLTLIAELEKLQVTLYDDTTFDRYYFAFDQQVKSAALSGDTDENFKASVEMIEPGTTVSTAGSFVDGLPTEYTFAEGGILITIGDGTDLTKISANGGSLTVNF